MCNIQQQGQEVMSSIVSYDTIFPKPGWAEQDPHDFWQSVVTGTKQLIEKGLNPKEVAVIGLSGHMNGCIPLDENGEVLYNNIIHSDSRTDEQCDFIRQNIDDETYYRITGNRIDPHYTLPKVLWLKAVLYWIYIIRQDTSYIPKIIFHIV